MYQSNNDVLCYEFVIQLVADILSDETIEKVLGSMNMEKTQDQEYYKPEFFTRDDSGTSQISVLGPQCAVGIPSTINYL